MMTTRCDDQPTTHHDTAIDQCLVGISPSYWAHVPMHIAEIQNLELINGINCRISSSTASSKRTTHKFIPVSKCLIVGHIVSMKVVSSTKTTGSSYVVDDGTGLIDCIHWHDDSLYMLPSPFANDINNASTLSGDISTPCYQVGDYIRIHGKIKNVCAIQEHSNIAEHGQSERNTLRYIREVDVILIEIASRQINNRLSLNAECEHWQAISKHQLDDDGQSTRSTCADQKEAPYYGGDWLALLGPNTIKQVGDRCFILPSKRKKRKMDKIFSASCSCTLQYKQSLVYCHCVATEESLDPHLEFRDATLQTLLEMEEQLPEQRKLFFQYSQVVGNSALQVLAKKQLVCNDVSAKLGPNEIFRKTFAALRQDGIVLPIDESQDMYLLVSRKRIFEPYVKEQLIRQGYDSFAKQVAQFSAGSITRHALHRERIMHVANTIPKSFEADRVEIWIDR